MSRGLGALQRRILETLDAAKAAMPTYRGAEDHAGKRWVVLGDYLVTLPPQVYDLRCSAAFLAQHDGHLEYGFPTRSFTACFSRAVHGLVDRGIFRRLPHVPVASTWLDRAERFYTGQAQIIHGDDWPKHPRRLDWRTHQVRFVTLSANPYQLALSAAGDRPDDDAYP
jgi:hypothetical protein